MRFIRNPGRDISFPIFTRKEIETKRLGKETKTISRLIGRHLPFPILSRIEIKTRKLERKSKQQISRLNNLSSSFSNHTPYFSGDYISQWLARIILI